MARAIEANLGGGRHRAVDVGDNSGYLMTFCPDLRVTSIDIEVNPKPLIGTELVLAGGQDLPIRDRAADVVVSCDALEHVPPAHRSAFVQELARCTSDLLVVAAPFDTPGVAGAEELVARYVRAATGAPQPQLVEHAEHGLPDLQATREQMEAGGLAVTEVGNGNLQDWVLGMFIKHQAVGRGGFGDLDIGFDVFYNLALEARSSTGPFYRHLLIGRRLGEPLTGAVEPLAQPQLDAGVMLSALAAVAPGSTGVLEAVAGLQAEQSVAVGHLLKRLDGMEEALSHLMARFDGVDQALGLLIRLAEADAARVESESQTERIGPVRRVARRLRRAGGTT